MSDTLVTTWAVTNPQPKQARWPDAALTPADLRKWDRASGGREGSQADPSHTDPQVPRKLVCSRQGPALCNNSLKIPSEARSTPPDTGLPPDSGGHSSSQLQRQEGGPVCLPTHTTEPVT